VYAYSPLAVAVAPHGKLYESHAVAEIVEDVLAFMVKFNVATESQPAAFVPLKVYTPLAV
jgi:hypothetical protein